MKTTTLVEYRTTPSVRLSASEAAALQQFHPRIAVVPSMSGDGYDLTASSWIGAIQLDDLAIEIRPKLSIRRVMFLLSYTLDPGAWRAASFDYAEEASVIEALAPGFITFVRRAIGRGLLQGYRHHDDALPVVRGRIDFDEQIRRRSGRVPPVEVRFDEFTEDIDENRLLLAATRRLARLRLRSRVARRALNAIAAALQNVTPVDYPPGRLPTIHYTRLNDHYRGALELAQLILRSTSIRQAFGGISSSAFLIDMNALFEDFVHTALREALGASDAAFPKGLRGRSLWLDTDRRIALQPDLSWWTNGGCVFVGDVKYKRIDDREALNPDVYQMLAYTSALGLPWGMLVYAGEQLRNDELRLDASGKRIAVRALNLNQAPDDLLTQVNLLATEVRSVADARTAHSLNRGSTSINKVLVL